MSNATEHTGRFAVMPSALGTVAVVNSAKRAGYSAPVPQFLNDSYDSIVGTLTTTSHFAVEIKQRNAWLTIIRILKHAVSNLHHGHIFLEFTIPRMGRRVDSIILADGCVFVVEFKVGTQKFLPADLQQVVGYALDLKNFHEPSHRLPIFPVLVATHAEQTSTRLDICAERMADDSVYEGIRSSGDNLAHCLSAARTYFGGSSLNALTWAAGRYKPTPTIIEAAQALYRNHRVEEITRNEAGAENLTQTASRVSTIIESCKRSGKKSICFITGVPGSGKTLAGLNIANLRTRTDADECAVFLSGNGPLVKVLRSALELDQKNHFQRKEKDRDKLSATRSIEQFIQNIHHFRDANAETDRPPIERVVLFDEAQRAWDRHTTTQFMRKKRNLANFDASEPEFLLSVMNRHQGWCTVICMVGHGQEINTGEAGLNEWLSALNNQFQHWQVYLSDRIVEDPGSFGISRLPSTVVADGTLHLSTAIRSFRSESVSAFVSAMIDGRPEEARTLSAGLSSFEYRITRDLGTARDWLRKHRRGVDRAGVLAFSNAVRLKAEGIFVKAEIDCVDWFLAEQSDVRSSDYLEDVGTEFDVQGLELDWVCVALDANLRIVEGSRIEPKMFRGTRWQDVKQLSRKQYILNAHRVLLTRARQGVVIFVPKGDARDPTRNPSWYSSLYEYFLGCGVQEL